MTSCDVNVQWAYSNPFSNPCGLFLAVGRRDGEDGDDDRDEEEEDVGGETSPHITGFNAASTSSFGG